MARDPDREFIEARAEHHGWGDNEGGATAGSGRSGEDEPTCWYLAKDS